MTGEIIKSFLVGLGFEVDDSSLSKFNKAIADATLKVTALYATLDAAAVAIGYGVTQISEDFEQMGYEYRLIAPTINKALILRRELLKAYSSAGINIVKVIQSSVKLNMSLAKTRFAFKAIYDSVGSRFFELITKQSDIFRKKLYDNMPKIQNVLEHLVKFLFSTFDATISLGHRLWDILTSVYDFFVKLDKATDGWSTIVIALISAWKLLNLSFLATPLGLLLSLGLALLTLWDDFKTFKEGGQSLIDWGSDFTKMIVGLATAVAAVGVAFGISKLAILGWGAISTIITLVKELNLTMAILEGIVLVLEAPLWAIVAVIGAIIAALTLADSKWKIFGGGLSGFFTGIGGKVLDFLGGNTAKNIQNNSQGASLGSPLGANSANSLTNQHVQQQTTINVQGSPNAGETAGAVAGHQNNINFNLVRNLGGASR